MMGRYPETFIEAHMAYCHRTGNKKSLIPEGTPHHGKGAYRRVNERQRKRDCAKSLYRDCLKLGIEPTPIRDEYRKAYKATESQQSSKSSGENKTAKPKASHV